MKNVHYKKIQKWHAKVLRHANDPPSTVTESLVESTKGIALLIHEVRIEKCQPETAQLGQKYNESGSVQVITATCLSTCAAACFFTSREWTVGLCLNGLTSSMRVVSDSVNGASPRSSSPETRRSHLIGVVCTDSSDFISRFSVNRCVSVHLPHLISTYKCGKFVLFGST